VHETSAIGCLGHLSINEKARLPFQVGEASQASKFFIGVEMNQQPVCGQKILICLSGWLQLLFADSVPQVFYREKKKQA